MPQRCQEAHQRTDGLKNLNVLYLTLYSKIFQTSVLVFWYQSVWVLKCCWIHKKTWEIFSIFILWKSFCKIDAISSEVFDSLVKPSGWGDFNVISFRLIEFLFQKFIFIIVLLGVHCDVYKSSYNISQLNSPPQSLSFILPPPVPEIISKGLVFPFTYIWT
jgi:hypothetical protein